MQLPISSSVNSDFSLNSPAKYVMDDLNTAPVKGHVSDENARPMPLRITKQRGQENSSKNLTQLRHVVPSRNSSLSKNRTSVEIQRVDGAASSSLCSNDTPDVQKRGHFSNFSSDSSATQEKISSDKIYEQSRELHDSRKSNAIVVLPKVGRKLDERSRVGLGIERPPTRSVTTGSIDPSGLSNKFIDGPLISLAPTPLVFQRRPRAATTQGPNLDRRRDEHVDQSTNPDVKRQSSFKRRLISRVMSGLTSKQNTNHSAMAQDGSIQGRCTGITRETSVRGTQGSSNGITQEISDGSTQDSSTRESSGGFTRSRVGSAASSVNTTSVWGSELENSLATFPTPPVNISPLALKSQPTFSSMATTLNGAAMSECCPTSKYVAIPSIEINAVSELTNLNSEDGKSIFVAVEVEGILNQAKDGENKSRLHHALEVAVIIDNSLFASPATLMASCEAARHLAALLDMSDDRLAILSTSPMRSGVPQSRIVQPLSIVDTRRVKLAVDRVVGSTELPRREVNVAAIECAKDLLARSPTSALNRGSPISFGHIFMLTANPSGIASNLLHDENVQIHVVCPGSVPWKSQNSVQCNGWKLRSLYRSETEFVSANKDVDPNSLFHRLGNVILHARGGSFSGKLTELVLDIRAGIDCSIEGVIGKKYHSSLQPGEVVTALVRVKVGQPNPSSPPPNEDSISPSFTTELLDELDSILRISSTTLLTAELKYKYSLFPYRTRCSIGAESNIKQEAPGSEYDKALAFKFPPQPNPSQIWVQKRQVFHLATHYSPRHAISSLLSHFGVEGRDSACPNYVTLVMEELKYQARILDRLEAADVISITGSDGENLYEHFGQGLFDINNFKPREWMPEPLGGFISGFQESVRADKRWNNQESDRSESSKNNESGGWLANILKNGTDDDNDGSDQSTIMGSSRYMLTPRSKATKTRDKLKQHRHRGSDPLTSNNEESKYRLDSPNSDARTIRSDDSLKAWTQKGNLSRSDSQRRQLLPPGPRQAGRAAAAEYPKVIITRDEEERAKVVKLMAIRHQRSFGGGDGSQTPRGENRGFPPWA